MQLHFAHIQNQTDYLLLMNFLQMGYTVRVQTTGVSTEYQNIIPQYLLSSEKEIPTETIIVVPHLNATSLTDQIIQKGVSVLSYGQLLSEFYQNKTRVVISGHKGKTSTCAMVVHVMNYHNQNIDYLLFKEQKPQIKLSKEADFVVIDTDELFLNNPNFDFFNPIIGLYTNVATGEEALAEQFISHIRNGGILIYDQTDDLLNDIVQKSEVSIRKIGYQMPAYVANGEKLFLNTEEGYLPLLFNTYEQLKNTEAARWICQNMGIDQADFFNAIAEFKL